MGNGESGLSGGGGAGQLLAAMHYVVDRLPGGSVTIKGVVGKVPRYQILTKYPPDLVCQLHDVCAAGGMEMGACHRTSFRAFCLAVAARKGLVPRPVDPEGAVMPSGLTIYLDQRRPDVMSAETFDAYVHAFVQANCASEPTRVRNPKTGRLRKACTLDSTRRRSSGRCSRETR